MVADMAIFVWTLSLSNLSDMDKRAGGQVDIDPMMPDIGELGLAL
jgi:hypothetical protein